jgi:3-isopropylmalate dehydrogenase
MNKRLLLLGGDGIGPEVVAEARKLIDILSTDHGLAVTCEEGLVGGAAYDAEGTPLPTRTLEQARLADAILLGAVGGPAWEALPYAERPERGLLGIRAALDLYANLRPAMTYPELAAASSLKPQLVAGLDLMIVRELTGGIYFGEPRGIKTADNGERTGFNTLVYSEPEIERIARTAFEVAQVRGRRVNAAMQLVRQPRQFDVIVTTNMFGDILSDVAAMLTGSIGMLPSASLNSKGQGMYEPVHGSAPDIAGKGIANPLATVLSVAMMLRYSLGEAALADRVDRAVARVIADGLRTADIYQGEGRMVGTAEMGDAVIAAL